MPFRSRRPMNRRLQKRGHEVLPLPAAVRPRTDFGRLSEFGRSSKICQLPDSAAGEIPHALRRSPRSTYDWPGARIAIMRCWPTRKAPGLATWCALASRMGSIRHSACPEPGSVRAKAHASANPVSRLSTQQRLTGVANIFERELIHYLVCALGDVLCRETLPDLARYRTRYRGQNCRAKRTCARLLSPRVWSSTARRTLGDTRPAATNLRFNRLASVGPC
jgi:hypothetical protein